jgi:RimJ/RimL family protein N-acetyltransferase
MKTFPKKQPTLETERLILRALQKDDAKMISKLANDADVARYLSSSIPYPYELQDAYNFVENSKKEYENNEQINFVIIEKKDNHLIGATGIGISKEHNHGTIGYWIGKEFWYKGYTVEATKALVKFVFEELELYRVSSHHFHPNPASGKVMQKIGLKLEGKRDRHYKKGDEYFDILDYGLLRSEYKG